MARGRQREQNTTAPAARRASRNRRPWRCNCGRREGGSHPVASQRETHARGRGYDAAGAQSRKKYVFFGRVWGPKS